jgi:hypothetical protein
LIERLSDSTNIIVSLENRMSYRRHDKLRDQETNSCSLGKPRCHHKIMLVRTDMQLLFSYARTAFLRATIEQDALTRSWVLRLVSYRRRDTGYYVRRDVRFS